MSIKPGQFTNSNSFWSGLSPQEFLTEPITDLKTGEPLIDGGESDIIGDGIYNNGDVYITGDNATGGGSDESVPLSFLPPETIEDIIRKVPEAVNLLGLFPLQTSGIPLTALLGLFATLKVPLNINPGSAAYYATDGTSAGVSAHNPPRPPIELGGLLTPSRPVELTPVSSVVTGETYRATRAVRHSSILLGILRGIKRRNAGGKQARRTHIITERAKQIITSELNPGSAEKIDPEEFRDSVLGLIKSGSTEKYHVASAIGGLVIKGQNPGLGSENNNTVFPKPDIVSALLWRASLMVASPFEEFGVGAEQFRDFGKTFFGVVVGGGDYIYIPHDTAVIHSHGKAPAIPSERDIKNLERGETSLIDHIEGGRYDVTLYSPIAPDVAVTQTRSIWLGRPKSAEGAAMTMMAGIGLFTGVLPSHCLLARLIVKTAESMTETAKKLKTAPVKDGIVVRARELESHYYENYHEGEKRRIDYDVRSHRGIYIPISVLRGSAEAKQPAKTTVHIYETDEDVEVTIVPNIRHGRVMGFGLEIHNDGRWEIPHIPWRSEWMTRHPLGTITPPAGKEQTNGGKVWMGGQKVYKAPPLMPIVSRGDVLHALDVLLSSDNIDQIAAAIETLHASKEEWWIANELQGPLNAYLIALYMLKKDQQDQGLIDEANDKASKLKSAVLEMRSRLEMARNQLSR